MKKEIMDGISPKEVQVEWYTLEEDYIDDAVINKALIEYKNVYILHYLDKA